MEIRQIVLPIFLSGAMTPVLAGDLYLLGAVGQSQFDVAQGTIDKALKRAGARNISSSTDDTDTAYKIQVGYQFNPYFAIEGGYVDLGKATYTASFNGGSAKASIKASGINLAVLGMFPVNESLSLFGKLGVINAEAKTDLRATGLTASVSNTTLRAGAGLGLNYNLEKSIAARIEYEEFYKLGDTDGGTDKVGMWSVAILYRF